MPPCSRKVAKVNPQGLDSKVQAFLSQALALKTTADIPTVDGGNIAAALR